MKKKLLASLIVLIMLCMPMFCLTGCESESGSDITFEVSATSVSVAKGESFSTVKGLTITINFQTKKWDQSAGKYRYAQLTDNNEYTYSDDPINYYKNNVVFGEKGLSLAEASAYGVVITGFDSSEFKSGETKRTMTIKYYDKEQKVDYTVT